jgi:hypothetical protein
MSLPNVSLKLTMNPAQKPFNEPDEQPTPSVRARNGEFMAGLPLTIYII